MSYSNYIFPNNFVPDETTGKFIVTVTAEALSTAFNSDENSYVVKCLRLDGERYREILFYWEVWTTGDVKLYFDETFTGLLTIAHD